MRTIIKHITLSMMAVAIISGCTSHDKDVIDIDNPTQESKDWLRTAQEAVDIAKDAWTNLYSTSRSAKVVMGEEFVQSIYARNSRSDKDDPVLYLVPCEDENGFVLVGANVNAPEVVAVIEDGYFESFQTQTNEAFQEYLSSTIDLLSSAIDPPGIVKPFLPQEIGHTDTTYVNKKAEKRLAVEWNQYWPEGYYASNGVPGSVATGIAQIGSYFELPTTLKYTYSGHLVDSETLDWTEMKKHVRSGVYACAICSATSDAHMMLARLCRQIGEDANAEYNLVPVETKVDEANILPAMEKYLSGKTITTYTDQSSLQTKLLSDGVAGISMSTDSGTQFYWVADGAWTYTRIITYTGPEIRETPEDQPIDDIVTFVVSKTVNNYVHYNWGFGGNCNGYFLVGVNQLDDAYEYDNPELGNNIAISYDLGYNAYYVQ